jgi:FixJ family two-component response regulator
LTRDEAAVHDRQSRVGSQATRIQVAAWRANRFREERHRTTPETLGTGASTAMQPLISVVDDDALIGLALEGLLQSAGYRAHSFTSANAFLAAYDPEVPGCVVTDLVMPEMSGLQLQGVLGARDYCPPIVFFTGQGDVNAVAQAMRAGAVDFLCKPVQADDLLAAVREALVRDTELRAKLALRRRVRGLMDRLTPRERVVFELVVAGLPNKIIAARLGRSEKTIKSHRMKVMEKMCVRSAVALLQLLIDGDMAPAPRQTNAASQTAIGSCFPTPLYAEACV